MSESPAPVQRAEIVPPPPNAPVDKAPASAVQQTQGSQVTMAPASSVQETQGDGDINAPDPENVQETQGTGETHPEGEVVDESTEVPDEEDLSGGKDDDADEDDA